MGFPGGASGKELFCQCRRAKRLGFNPMIAKIPWRRAWQHTRVFLPGKFHGWRSLVGYSTWGRKESDMTERLHFLSFYSSFWRRKWQPTPMFLPGESRGQRGLVGYSLWGCKESDTTKQLTYNILRWSPLLPLCIPRVSVQLFCKEQ